ncbi:xanthine dehydrogenase family protein molybdopterin-binding subunit [Amycolatopsis jejuensis]|uniref:xanthine dehydrogenase family protein molybdopterin-binding subunit n=1 Tax=Amycolatopsis jejuensis TaxID=330084 RepID=UPI000527EE93|nr:xanthine dehydrogenase family protein molybdopterin-binding subunit [Amycolatopsis jejuensis]
MPRLTHDRQSGLLRGTGAFLADLEFDDVLEVAFVRSPVPYARITSIDLGTADGFTGADLAGEIEPLVIVGHGLGDSQWQPLPADRVRFVGEPVALVWAADRYHAEDLADQADVDYEPLPDGTPLHEGIPDGVFYRASQENGDVDDAFARAYRVYEETFSTSRVSAMPMECRGVVASWEDDRLTVWTSTQIPDIVRLVVAKSLGLAERAVRVVVPDVGGGFGLKAHVFPEEVAVAAAARKLGRTVRWVEDRRENLIASAHAHETTIKLRVAVSEEGRFLAVDQETVHDAGAYSIYPHSPISETITCASAVFGPYDLEGFRYVAQGVASNRCPAGVHRGVGALAAVHATERMVDLIARDLDLDQFEIRYRNRIPELPGRSASGSRIDSGDYASLLELLRERGEYDRLCEVRDAARAEGRLVGVGIGLFNEGSGVCAADYANRGMESIPGYDASRVVVKDDGRIEIRTSAAEAGQGHAETYRQIAAQELGVSLDVIDVLEGDTDLCPPGTGTFASRGAVGVFESLVQALRAVKKLDVEPGADETRTVDQQHVVAQCAALAVVEVDPVSYLPSVTAMTIVHDCGVVIKEDLVNGQVQGGAANGIGCVLMEAHAYDEGRQIVTSSLVDYLLPLATDVPEVSIVHYESPSPVNTLGSKGCGEVGTIAPHGAVANAVVDAVRPLGIAPTRLPYRPEDLLPAAGRGLR